MARTVFWEVLRLGRLLALAIGIMVMIAALLGLASMALGANGAPFLLGKKNVASKVSRLVKSGEGPALRLQVEGGPPLAVNSAGRVADLNADLLDGQDSSAFLRGGDAAGGDLSGNYPNPEIANNAVTSAGIANGEVRNDDIADNAINGAKLDDNAVGSAEVADRSLRVSDYAIGHVPTGTINVSTTNAISPGQCLDQIFGAGAAQNGDLVLYFPADTSAMPQGLILQPTGVATVVGGASAQARMRMCNVGSTAIASGATFPVKFLTLR